VKFAVQVVGRIVRSADVGNKTNDFQGHEPISAFCGVPLTCGTASAVRQRHGIGSSLAPDRRPVVKVDRFLIELDWDPVC